MALLIGPAGIALMGNFRSFLTTLQSVSTLGIREGVVKFISEKRDDEAALKKVFSTAFLVVLATSLLLGIAIFLSSEFLDDYLFPNASYVLVFKTAAFLVPLSAFHIFLLAVLNGFHRYKKVIGINIILSVLGLGIMLVLMWTFGLEGALLAAVLG
ncbi:MAG: oligosaccharide flippase family protein, partial [Bacteroidota bacterium]